MRRNHGFAARLTLMTLMLTLTACGSGATSSGPTSSPGASASAASPTPILTAPSTTTSAATPAPGTATSFAYVPLWPFASVAAAEKWQREALPGGHQPWHLDAGAVAVAFARQYLRFGEVDHVVRTTASAFGAHVAVGYTVDGQTGTAAVVHLVRIGSGPSRPWEVVGTDDTATFSVTRPRYGSTVSGTIRVGGRIAGVDESIRVTARQLSGVVGSYCCLPAGAPVAWSVPVRLTSPGPGPITIVASTGGHLAAVERFAITGVRSVH